MDGVAEWFYLWARSQGKAYGYSIRDKVSNREKGFEGFCKNKKKNDIRCVSGDDDEMMMMKEEEKIIFTK